jgi:hypothetical protein
MYENIEKVALNGDRCADWAFDGRGRTDEDGAMMKHVSGGRMNMPDGRATNDSDGERANWPFKAGNVPSHKHPRSKALMGRGQTCQRPQVTSGASARYFDAPRPARSGQGAFANEGQAWSPPSAPRLAATLRIVSLPWLARGIEECGRKRVLR